MVVDIGSETSKLHAKMNSIWLSFIDSLSDEMRKALAIAVGTTVAKQLVMETWKASQMIFRSRKRKADDEADGLQNNYGKLMELVKKLSFGERDILALKKTKLLTQVFEDWLSRVEKIKGEVQELQNKYKSELRRSQHWSSESRTSLSESMAEKCCELDCLLGKSSDITMQVKNLPELVIKMEGPVPEDEPYLLPNVKVILDHLRKENVKRIGLLGEQKNGKTWIIQSLNNNEQAAEMFDIIIWVSAPEVLDVIDLHRIIAGRLKLNVEGITESREIFHQIYSVLKGKRCLLILDEVSGTFDPSWIGNYGNEKDSKVVLTARDRPVCLRMKAEPLTVVEMSGAVAWKIFQEKVGQNVINDPLVRPIAELVANACRRSPQVIHQVAIEFRVRETPPMWEEGLRILQGWPGTDIDHLVELLRM